MESHGKSSSIPLLDLVLSSMNIMNLPRRWSRPTPLPPKHIQQQLLH